MQPGEAGFAAKGFANDLRAKARPAHAKQCHIGKARPPDILGELLQLRDTLELLVDDPQPS